MLDNHQIGYVLNLNRKIFCLNGIEWYLLAEQTQHNADDDEHQCHASQNSNHGRINVATWFTGFLSYCFTGLMKN